MSRMEGAKGLSDDARFELAMNAAGHARRNRPTALVAASGAVFAASLIAALWGFSARVAAREAYRHEQADLAQVEVLKTEWTRLDESAKQAGSADATKPFPYLQSTIESCARNAGLKNVPQPPHLTANPRGPMTSNEYLYQDVKDPSLPALLEWIRQSMQQVPGLEVYQLVLRPQATDWSVNVTFRRLEKSGS